jgi:hypothetical protein
MEVLAQSFLFLPRYGIKGREVLCSPPSGTQLEGWRIFDGHTRPSGRPHHKDDPGAGNWYPEFRPRELVLVSNNSANLQRGDEPVASVDAIENHSTLLYSVHSGILLSLKKLPKRDGSSPFFGTKSLDARGLRR